VPLAWSCAGAAVVAAKEALVALPAAVVSVEPSVAFGLAEIAGCCGTAAVESVVPEASALFECLVSACAATAVLAPEPLTVTGALAAIVVVIAGSAEAVAPVCGAVRSADTMAVCFALVWVAAFVVVPVVAVPAASASGVVAADVADWLAAIAAAAMASGAVLLVEAGADAVDVTAMVVVTGMTTAMTAGAAAVAVPVPSCEAGSVVPFVEAEVEPSADESDVVESLFEDAGLVRERGGASVLLLLALASEAGPLSAS